MVPPERLARRSLRRWRADRRLRGPGSRALGQARRRLHAQRHDGSADRAAHRLRSRKKLRHRDASDLAPRTARGACLRAPAFAAGDPPGRARPADFGARSQRAGRSSGRAAGRVAGARDRRPAAGLAGAGRADDARRRARHLAPHGRCAALGSARTLCARVLRRHLLRSSIRSTSRSTRASARWRARCCWARKTSSPRRASGGAGTAARWSSCTRSSRRLRCASTGNSPRCRRIARAQRAFAESLAGIDGLSIEPAPPQVNLFHLHFQAPAEALTAARDRIAGEDGAWLAPRFSADRGPGHASAEIYVGDSLLAIPRSDDRRLLAPLYARMLELARAGATAAAAQ